MNRERVFLVLSGEGAYVVETVLRDRIDKIDDTECNAPAVREELNVERAHLARVVGQLMAPGAAKGNDELGRNT